MHILFKPLLLLCTAAAAVAACEGDASRAPAYQLASSASGDNAEFSSPADALRAAEALRASGANAEAQAVMAAAYRRFPDNAAVVSAYGRLALINGHDALAARLLKDATASAPEDWRALSAQGVLDSRNGRMTDARKALIRARAASGEDAAALNNLAVSCLLDGRPAEAASLLRQALASPLLKPAYLRRIRRNLALALAMDGQFDEAERHAGEKLPRELRHASAATVRRFIGLGGAAFPGPETPAAHFANSWRPVEDSAAQ